MRRNRLFLVFTVLLISLMALSAAPAMADDGVQAKNLTDVTGASPRDTAPAVIGDGAGQIIAGAVTTYSVRANFTAAYPSLPFEDFETDSCTAITGFPAPLNSTNGGPCYAAGAILPGLELRDNPLNGESPNGLVFAPAGTLGLPDDWVGANTFTNSLEIVFTPTVQAAGLDVASVTSATPLRIRVYGPGNSLSYETTYASVGPTGSFFGAHDPSGIARIELLANNGVAGNGAEGLLGILFGDTGGGGDGITLEKTVGTDPSTCATTDVITVTAGTDVTYCYEVTNNSEVTLSLHNLEDDQLGTVLANFPYDLGPGESVFVTETDNITTDTTNTGTWTAFNPVSYEVITGTCEVFPDISATGTPLNLGDDGSADVTMPFNFQFYDITSNIATVGNNGGMFIGQPGFFIPFTNEALPSASVPYSILPFWDDLIQFEAGANQYAGVYTPTFAFRDSGGNIVPLGGGQIFAVQWDGLDHYNFDPDTGAQIGTPSEATFTTLLFGPGNKGAGAITTCYNDTDFDAPQFDFGVSATIGLNQGADNALQYSFETAHPELNGNFAITYFPAGGGESYSDSDSATVNTVAPDITVTPASIAENHPTPPQSTNRTLTIGNVGDAPLTWSIYEDSTRPTIPTVSRPVAPIAPNTVSSAGHAPINKDNAFAGNQTPVLNLGDPIPAYAYRFTFEGTDIVEFPDILTPGTQVSVAPNARSLFSGDFVAGDFTTLYAIDSDTNQFVAIDTGDGSETVLGTSTPAGGESWSGLSYDPTNNTLYGSATSCASSTLYTINPTNGAATAVGNVAAAGCLIDIAVSPDGDMYGIDIINDVTLAINKNTGAGTVLGSTGIDANFAQGMDFDDASGVLYYAAFNNGTFNGELRTVDLTSGATTLVGPFGADTTEIDAFAIATGGSPRCDDPSDISWLSLSTTNGTTAPGGSNNVTVTFNSASLANGVYTGTLCVESNDFDELLTRVPVTLTVGPPTAINLTGINVGAGGVPMVAFAAAGGLLLAVAGLLLRKRED